MGEQVKIYGTMLKSSQENALILIFSMDLKICHEDLLTYVACNEGYFLQTVFLHTRFYKNVARLVFIATRGERKCIFQDMIFSNTRLNF